VCYPFERLDDSLSGLVTVTSAVACLRHQTLVVARGVVATGAWRIL